MAVAPRCFFFDRSTISSPRREISTSLASIRNSFGRRTACELPDLKTRAVAIEETIVYIRSRRYYTWAVSFNGVGLSHRFHHLAAGILPPSAPSRRGFRQRRGRPPPERPGRHRSAHGRHPGCPG